MLDPDYLRHVTEGSEQIASLLHTELIKIIVQAIVTRMARGDDYRLTARDRWMLEVLQAAGYLRQDLEREIAAKTRLMRKEIRAAFEDAGVRSLAWDDAVYIAAGLEPTPLRQSPMLMRLLQRGYEKTAGEWVNFTGTTADAAQQLFVRECDKAYSLVASGGMSHAQAVRQAVETVAREGVTVTYPTGHKDTVETAVARAVRTGVGQACGEMSTARMREMRWKIVLVSAHLGARTGDGGENFTNHFWWQGKFYRLDDEDGSGTEQPADAAQPQQDEAEHPKIAATQSGSIQTGAQTGAKKTEGWEDRHAERYYEEVRRRAPYSDAKKIAQHVEGFSVQDIEDIRQHVFLKEQPRSGGYARFDASYEQAEVWQRLVEGKSLRESDIVFLRHELLELTIMREKGYTYEQAHELANKKYDWWKAYCEEV